MLFLGLQFFGPLFGLLQSFSGCYKVSRCVLSMAAIFFPCAFAFSLGLLQRFRFRSACMRFSFGLLQSFSLCVRAIFYIGLLLQNLSSCVHAFFSDYLMQSFIVHVYAFSSRAVAKFIVVLACF